MKKTILAMAAAGVGLWLCAAVFSGCETTDDTAGITVTPGYVELTSETNTVLFTATVVGDLALPLTWSVFDSSLGAVSGSGSNAVYVRSASGDNMVYVEDQYGHKGEASVHQP